MDRAFKTMKLPLGAYQHLLMNAYDLGTYYTNGGLEPRSMIMTVASPIGTKRPFTYDTTQLMLSEEAQRHMIAALQANLDDDKQRARELIVVFHPKYGDISQ